MNGVNITLYLESILTVSEEQKCVAFSFSAIHLFFAKHEYITYKKEAMTSGI